MKKMYQAIVALCVCVATSCSDAGETAFYVSPDGNDNHSGAIDAPFLTVERAQQAVRACKQGQGLPSHGITVYLREGIYPLHQTLHFTGEDSGTESAPVVYRACPGETVRFTGGEVVKNFVPLNDPEAKARINGKYHENIVQVNLKEQGIDNLGAFQATGFGKKEQTAPLELFFNGEPMTLARYPNDNGWMHIASVPLRCDNPELIDKRTGEGIHCGSFEYEGDRPATWLKNDDIWLQGYWVYEWADSYVKVASIDVARKEFVLQPPHGAYGYRKGKRFYALNILEELDSPGEWFLDRGKGILYFWPPEPVDKGIAIVSVLEDLMLRLDSTNYVRIEGITFESSRGSAIKVEGGSHNVIGGCTVRNIGNSAVYINGGTYNGVEGCDFYNLGDAGIYLDGGDRLTLTPAHNYATNNHIHHFSRINRTYRPAISMGGVGNLISHNYIHDAPHMAVSFGGNDNILEYNEVHDIAIETGDVGAFYAGRQWTMRGNIVRYNYFHQLDGSAGLHNINAVYLDDGFCGTTISGNVFYQAGKATFVGGGHDNLIENNVFVDCSTSIHLDARYENWAKQYYLDGSFHKQLEEVKYDQPPYSTHYPELAKIFDVGEPIQPKGNVFRTNLSFGAKEWKDLRTEVDEVTIENNYVLQEIPAHVDVEKGKFYPEDEKILERMHFQKIPFDSIGLYIDNYRPTLPARRN